MGTSLTRLARVARIVEQPPFWGGVATALTVKGGARGRQAALRGSLCYVIAAFIANIVIKPLTGRRRPHGASEGRIGPYTSSFPSGHTASDSAFVFGVAQELPLLAIPLAGAATAAHWSLIRSGKSSCERRVRRWCDRTGRGIHYGEVVANKTSPWCGGHRRRPVNLVRTGRPILC